MPAWMGSGGPRWEECGSRPRWREVREEGGQGGDEGMGPNIPGGDDKNGGGGHVNLKDGVNNKGFEYLG